MSEQPSLAFISNKDTDAQASGVRIANQRRGEGY